MLPGTTVPAPPVTAVAVITPSGQNLNVLGQGEEVFYRTQAKSYLDEFAFTSTSDLLDLDRLLFFELLIYRSSSWIGAGKDYDGMEIDVVRERRSLKENSELLSKVKNDLGMTKSQRDKAAAEDVGAYLTNLKARAREFGIHRETQLGKALELINQMFSIVGAFDRSDAEERKKIGFETEADILEWIREVMRPEYDLVDAYFRANAQRHWVRSI